MRSVRLADVIQLSKAKTKESAQTLSLQAADPRFDVAIYDGCTVRSAIIEGNHHSFAGSNIPRLSKILQLLLT
jgi:hypothetical protein